MHARKLSASVLVLAVLAAGCTATRSTTEAIEVSLSEFKITPSKAAPAGEPFSIEVRNDGAAPHSLVLDTGTKRFETAVLGAGESGTLQIPASKAGSYRLWCGVSGHREAGMEAMLTVAENPEAEGTVGQLSSDEMDAAHEAGIKAFPAKTAGTGGSVMDPKIIDGVKVFEVTATALRWEVSPGKHFDAYAYNEQIPGPEIRVRTGDRVRVVFNNSLPESSSIHFHGVEVPNAMDGVPFITQPPVKKGESFTYEFTIVDQPGTYMYHSHHNAAVQVGKGLLGAFIVEGDVRDWDVEHTMIVGDGPLGYTINGKGFPATSPISAALGQKVLVRFLNEGQLIHPMHLHGFHFTVVSRDGRPVAPYEVDTLSVAPGERYDVVFTATLPGVWAFHCHILSHVESEHGMHGMVTAVIVK